MSFVVTINGSPAAISRSAGILDYFRAQLNARGIETQPITIRDLPADDLLHGRYDSEAIKAHIALVERADGVILATPVYKAAYTGVLKVFLDMLPANALAGKRILPIVGGAAPNHTLVLDYALKPVLGALGANHIMAGLYTIDSQFTVAPDPGSPPGFSPELESKLHTLIENFANQLN